jgi:hypothetical protein
MRPGVMVVFCDEDGKGGGAKERGGAGLKDMAGGEREEMASEGDPGVDVVGTMWLDGFAKEAGGEEGWMMCVDGMAWLVARTWLEATT